MLTSPEKSTIRRLIRTFNVIVEADGSLVQSFPTYLGAAMFIAHEKEPMRSKLIVRTEESSE